MALLYAWLLYHRLEKKRKSPGGHPPGQIREGRKLNYRAMRGVGSGESVTPGASADLPVLAGVARAETTGSALRVGVARGSPSRTQVSRSYPLCQSLQTSAPGCMCAFAS